MELEDAMELFSKVAKDFTVVLLARPKGPMENPVHVKDSLPVFDALELLRRYDCLVTENGMVVTKAETLERPVKILFFMLIMEVEYSLYKILKQYADSPESLERLRSLQLNDMIREFFALQDPFNIQDVYSKKQEMKSDLKAVSSFRNVNMHSNRKIDLETGFETVLKRKGQMLKLLDAMGQIMENLKAKKGKLV
jgi:hypothetical protein